MEEEKALINMCIEKEYTGCLFMTPKDASAVTAVMHAGYVEVLVGSKYAFCFRHKEYLQLMEALERTSEFLGPDGPLGLEGVDSLWTNCFVIYQVDTGRVENGIPVTYDMPMIENEDLFLQFAHKICGIAPVMVPLRDDYTYWCDSENYKYIITRNGWLPIETAAI